jgi:hypothetical protein
LDKQTAEAKSGGAVLLDDFIGIEPSSTHFRKFQEWMKGPQLNLASMTHKLKKWNRCAHQRTFIWEVNRARKLRRFGRGLTWHGGDLQRTKLELTPHNILCRVQGD